MLWSVPVRVLCMQGSKSTTCILNWQESYNYRFQGKLKLPLTGKGCPVNCDILSPGPCCGRAPSRPRPRPRGCWETLSSHALALRIGNRHRAELQARAGRRPWASVPALRPTPTCRFRNGVNQCCRRDQVLASAKAEVPTPPPPAV